MRKETIEEKLRRSKTEYDSMEIPEELGRRVSRAAGTGVRRNLYARRRKHRYIRTAAAAAAALLICFTAGLNASPAFAAVMREVPVLGSVSRLLTFRTYDYEDQDKTIHEVIPQIREEEAAAGSLEQTINSEIENSMAQYKKDAQQRIEEYKEAFIATGGTEEEFAQKGIRVDAGYEVYYESEGRLSFVITANESWCGAYGIRRYYNLDLKTGTRLTLEDLLGKDYVEMANRAVREQMEERMKQDADLVYWGDDMGGFTTVDRTTDFYINGAGNPVVVFDKYEIAPGAFGIQEFEIRP